MPHTLLIKEQQESYWKLIAAVTAVLAVVLFLVYLDMSDVFWSGIVQLASFASFAGAILSGLKAMEGSLTLEVGIANNTLVLSYLKKSERILEEEHKLDDIKSISYVEEPAVLSSKPHNVFVVKFRDSDKKYDLFHFSGRSLKIDRDDADRLIRFFDERGIQTDEL